MKKNNIPFLKSFSRYPLYIAVSLLFCLLACSNNGKSINKEHNNTQGLETRPDSTSKKIVMVTIPEGLTTFQEKVDYLSLHFWDNFNFSDSTYTRHPNKIMEQAFIDYIEILSQVDQSKAINSIIETLKKAEVSKPMLLTFTESYKKYFYDPNSPLRNDEYYIPVVDHIIKSKSTNSTELERAKFEMNLLLKNRIGNKATDFNYTLPSGDTEMLYSIKKPYTILMFYNPDCHACGEILNYMKESPVINKALQSKLISILAFYPDKDLTIWRKHLPDIPNNWINGYDKEQTIEKKQLYDLKAIPTLYLLDKDKKVLLKDAPIETIILYLKNNNLFIFAD